MSESLAAEQYISTKLANLGTPVYMGFAPPTAPFPRVVVNQLSSVDMATHSADKYACDMLYSVIVVAKEVKPGEGGFSVIDPIADSIDTALRGVNVVVTAGTINGASREYGQSYTKLESGTTYYYRGAVHRIVASK